MPASDVALWWTRITLARERRKREADRGKKLLEAYLPPASMDADAINSNVHFRNVESKKAKLFFQLPDLQLTALPLVEGAVDPQTQQPVDPSATVAAKRELLNKLLGRDYADVKKLAIDPALTDVLLTIGIGPTKICYESYSQPTPMPVQTGEVPQQGSVLGLQTVPQMDMQMVPVPVHECWRWYRFSTSKYLIAHDWHSSDYDRAPWQGMEFVEPLNAQSRKAYGLPDDFVANATRDDLVLEVGGRDPGEGSASLIKGVELWIQASAYDDTVANPQRYRQLILIEGMKEAPAVYRDSPYQTVGPDGRLSVDSLIGNPIHPLTIRDEPDSAWPKSDSAFTDPLVKQKNTWRAQTIKGRDANLQRFLHSDRITTAIDKLKDADTGQGVAVEDELMARGIDKLIAPIPHLDRAESDIRGEMGIDQDLQETLGLGANQAGAMNPGRRSATEVATVRQSVSERLQGERARVIEWYLSGVRKFDALVQRYGDADNLTPIIGQKNTALILAWKSVNGRNAFDAKPDSQLAVDAADDRKNALDYQNFNAKNPMVDQLELSRIVASKFGFDPSRLVRQPPPPPPPAPPPPKISATFTAADLHVPEVRMLLGLPATPSPEAVQHAAQLAAAAIKPEHGGAADQVDKLSKHHGEITGQMNGAVPMGAPKSQIAVGVQ